jgi:hypothetical protein
MAGAGGLGGTTAAGVSGAVSAGAGGLGAGGPATGGVGTAGVAAGSGGASAVGGSAATAGTGTGGTSGVSGGSAGGASGSGGGAGNNGGGAGSAGNGGGGAGASAVCAMVKSEYAAELEKQLACNPNAGSQCTDRAAAAPGCDCRVFIEPSDPFAIEHLSNVAHGWFDADCSMPTCPAKCSTANAGTCQADPKSSLGGRCVTP